MPFSFDAHAAVLEKDIAKRVSELDKETAAAVRAVIVRGFREKLDPVVLARLLRQVIGLTTSQAQAVMNYRASLVGMGTDAGKAEVLVARYSARKLKERAEMVARTETMAVLNKGQQRAWEQGVEEGIIDEDDVQKVWIVTLDNPCPICEELAGTGVGINEEFDTETGEAPAHPGCRCTAGLRRAEGVAERRREIQQRLADNKR